MDSLPILASMLSDSLARLLDSASPAVVGLVSTISGWAAYRLRTTSEAAQLTSQRLAKCSATVRRLRADNASLKAALARKKSSSTTTARGSTSTSRGEAVETQPAPGDEPGAG